MADSVFPFDFEDRYRPIALMFGATPSTAGVKLGDDGVIRARFGIVSVETPATNVLGVEMSGDYRWWRAIGVRMSLTDRGLTFGSNTRHGVCLRFVEPIRPSPSLFKVKHPGLTLTLADPQGFKEAVDAARETGKPRARP